MDMADTGSPPDPSNMAGNGPGGGSDNGSDDGSGDGFSEEISQLHIQITQAVSDYSDTHNNDG